MHQIPSPGDLNAWCQSHIGESFDRVLTGQVFGGRYGESPQILKQASLTGETLHLRFNTTEILTILEPRNVKFEDCGLSIETSKEVEFGWHSYGAEQNQDNWNTIRYRMVDTSLVSERFSSKQVTPQSPAQEWKYVVQLVRGDA